MAEKITIVELDINEEAFVKSAQNTKKAIDELVVSQKKLTDAKKTSSKEFIKNDAQLKKLRSEYTQQKNAINALQSPYAKLSKTLQLNRNRAKDLAVQFGVNSKQARAARIEVQKLDTQLKRIDKSVGQSQRNVGNYGSALKGMASSFLGVTAVIYGAIRAFKAAFNTISKFEQKNAELSAILRLEKEDMQALNESAEELGATTAKTANEVVELQIAFARLGFTQREIIDLTKATIDGSIAMNSELDATANLVGAVVNSLDSLSTTDAPRIIDILSLSTATSALNFEKLSTQLPIVLGAANALEIPLTEVVATLGKLTDGGIEASTAATGLRNIFIESAKKGIDYKDAIQLITDSTDKLKTANELFGKRSAIVGLVVANNTEAIEKMDEALQDAAGTAEEMAEKQLDTLSGSLTLLGSAWNGLVLAIENGEGRIATSIRGSVDAFTALFNSITDIEKANDKIEIEATKTGGLLGQLLFKAKANSDAVNAFNFLEGFVDAGQTIEELAESMSLLEDEYDNFLSTGKEANEVERQVIDWHLERIDVLAKERRALDEKSEKEASILFEQKAGLIDVLLSIDKTLDARELEKKSIKELQQSLTGLNEAANKQADDQRKLSEKQKEQREKDAEEKQKQDLKNIVDFEKQKLALENEIELSRLEDKEEKDLLAEEQRFEKQLIDLEQQALDDEQKYILSEEMYNAHLLRLQEITDGYTITKEKTQTASNIKESKLLAKFAKQEIKSEETIAQRKIDIQRNVSSILIGLLGDNIAGKIAAVVADAFTSIAQVKATTAAAQAINLANATAVSTIDPTATTRAVKRNIVLGIQSKISQGLIVASGVLGLAKSFYDGGEIGGDANIPTNMRNKGGDDVLIQAKRGEVILNEQQQAKAGGSAFFNSIGVPGFATGGIVNSSTITNPITQSGENAEQINDLFQETIKKVQIVAFEEEITDTQMQKVEIVDGANI